MFVIRKNSLNEEQYLNRKGNWGPYPKAKRFSTQDAAVKFMEAHKVTDSGIFPCWRAKELWERRRTTIQYDVEGVLNEQPTERIFIITGHTLYQVCSTDDVDGELIFIYAQDDYDIIGEFSSMDEATAFCAVQYGLNGVETV